MVDSNLIYILNSGYFIDLESLLRIRMVHGSQNVSTNCDGSDSSSASDGNLEIASPTPTILVNNNNPVKNHGSKRKLQGVTSFNGGAAAGWIF